MSVFGLAHRQLVAGRRVRVLAGHIAPLLDPSASVLDVGAGDGALARTLLDLRPDVTIRGVDVLARPTTEIEVTLFDGHTLPFPDASFDDVLLVDVLHHADDPVALLGECARVARSAVVLKDHDRDGFLASRTLRFMDWVGNARYGVRLPYNYLSWRRWQSAFASVGLELDSLCRRLGLYPRPASWIFDRRLHFVARLRVDRRPIGGVDA
jgi:SAM-dependent methyltransferase